MRFNYLSQYYKLSTGKIITLHDSPITIYYFENIYTGRKTAHSYTLSVITFIKLRSHSIT